MWSLMVTLLLNFQSLLEFHRGQSWAPYCFYFISMTCPTIYNPMFVYSWMTLQCTWQSKVRKTQIACIQIDLNILQEWEKAWDMEFNASKYQVVHISWSCRPIKNKYTMHGQVLDSIDHARYLGVDNLFRLKL